MNAIASRPYPDLKTWRAAQRWTIQQASIYLGLSETHYARLERRTQTTTGKRAKAIMDKTGVPLEVLVGAA